MKKLMAALTLALLAGAASVPAQATVFGYWLDNPSGDGGCNPTVYSEDWSYAWFSWEIPALADGQSVEVGASMSWQDYSGYHVMTPDQYNSEKITFTCNNGRVSGNTSGFWDYG
ncbi:hypothetical protein ACLB1G_03530 [Oxalobacteraceae bacterium A2-2]